jgi:predicted unusual protein kinase regulating ubiquinone biosynthesis (AarF/ABC1/UbiB family)
MGGVMIKVGQFLSTRVDVLPEEITQELANLQDEVAPESIDEIKRVAEAELRSTISDSYLLFDPVPMAAASLGQVHRAKLHRAQERIQDVVVKIQRPNIQNIIATDLAALQTVGRWISRYPPISERADVPALLKEFSKITFEEIDYLAEGKNAETFISNFSNRPGVRVPKVIWSHTTKRVLTLENVQAIKITDYTSISNAGIDRKDVAQRLFETYLQQVFEDGFFHADPHPGNLFVEPLINQLDDFNNSDTDLKWTLNFVDFGMVGHIPPNLKSGLREMAIGIGTQDTNRLIRSYQLMGVLLPNANLELIKEFEAKAFEQFYGKTMTELQQISWDEMHEFAKEFRELIFEMPFQVPENLIFLGRCVAILSGMCTGLDPDFNFWEGISPFAQKIIREETLGGWDFWRGEILDWGKTFVNLPLRLNNVLKKVENDKLEVDTPILNNHAARLEVTGRKLINAVIFAVLFLSGVQLYLAEQLEFGISLIIASVLPLWRVIFGKT